MSNDPKDYIRVDLETRELVILQPDGTELRVDPDGEELQSVLKELGFKLVRR